jgi:uncharacterized protein
MTITDKKIIRNKLKILTKIIKQKESLAIAFSGGIDSSLIAKVAFDQLQNRAIAVTVDSDTFSARELIFAKKIAKEIGIKHFIIKHSELDNPIFRENPPNRCYHCKREEMDAVEKVADEQGISEVAFGVNASDHNEHRPGIIALKERNFFLPLEEAGIGKQEIPAIAKTLGLSNHAMPSTTCLASRIPYNKKICQKKLNQIELAEDFLFQLGLSQSRVRHHTQIARIEVPDVEFDQILINRKEIILHFKKLGFKYISLDLEGYRSGSMDEVLQN